MQQRQLPADIRPSDLPAPPQVALEILRACRDRHCDNARIAALATRDPALTAELLRIVNSAWFGFAGGITTVKHAVSILGQQPVRNLVLCIAVRDSLKATRVPGFEPAEYWEDSLRRAAAARALAPLSGLDPEECFTAGLLQDFGLLVAVHLAGPGGCPWASLRRRDPAERLRAERQAFGHTHLDLGAAVARRWELPPAIARAMACHHGEESAGEHLALCRLLECADWMAAVFAAAEPEPVLRECLRRLAASLGLSEEQGREHLQRLPAEVVQAAEALGLGVPEQDDFEVLMQRAQLDLAEQNIGYQELTWRLENALRERDRLAGELDRELRLAREIQRSLLPSPLSNRGCFQGINLPAKSLSGDFYDWFDRGDGQLCFNLGDVSGKGVNAAILMSKVSGLFRCLGKRIDDLREVLDVINTEVCETSVRGMFVTMAAGRYDPASGELWLCNAGQVPALLQLPDGRIAPLEADGPPLGILPERRQSVRRLRLDGASLYLFSDGLLEARAEDGGELGLAGLLELIRRHGEAPWAQRPRLVVEAVRRRSAELRDDLSMLLLHGGRA